MNFRMMSYADNFEDVMIQRAFAPGTQGFYLDIGAYNPVEHSVTKHFYDQGWHGINVEPNPAPFEELRSARPRDINLNIGLSNRAGEMKILEAPGACWSVDRNFLTSYFAAQESEIVERTIAVLTLAEICERHVPSGTTIDFLKVDVEGHEREVIEGGDWSRWRPRIILVEANGFEAWEPTLLGAAYQFTLFDGVNRFYVRGEDAHLIPSMSFPANASDRFSIYGYARRLSELENLVSHQAAELNHATSELHRVLDHYRQYSPAALKLAQHVGRASKRFPVASKVAKSVVHRLSRGA